MSTHHLLVSSWRKHSMHILLRCTSSLCMQPQQGSLGGLLHANQPKHRNGVRRPGSFSVKLSVFRNAVLSSFNVTFSHNSPCLHIKLHLVQSRQHVSSCSQPVLRALILLLQGGHFSHSQTGNCHLTWQPILELKPQLLGGQHNHKYLHIPRSTYSSSAWDRSVYQEKRELLFTVDCLLEWLFYTLLSGIKRITTLSLFKQTWSKNKCTYNYWN